MRSRINAQREIDFRPAISSLTSEYCQKYDAISNVLDDSPEIADLIHQELTRTAKQAGGSQSRYTSDTVLRVLLVMVTEGLSLRDTVVRIDDSHYLRRFARIYDLPMMDYTTLCKLKNQIAPETWQAVNGILGRFAVDKKKISGKSLRIDTTAVETDIHYPSDSALLWDTYRTLTGLIKRVRRVAPDIVGKGRAHKRRAKRLAQRIGRLTRKTKYREQMVDAYEALISMVSRTIRWSQSVADGLEGMRKTRQTANTLDLRSKILRYVALGARVVDQSQRRVLNGEQVPNSEKIFSIFEEHTELLKRGKAKHDIEYGHMIQIQQVTEKFITDYTVFDKRPVEHELLSSIVESHEMLFGNAPQTLAADRAYYQGDAVTSIEHKVAHVAIGKKGPGPKKSREMTREFQDAQRFRAGVEGSIAFLKRCLMLGRVLCKGFTHYTATVGMTVFAHNLIILSRL